MKAHGVALLVSGSRVQHAPEMLPAEWCSQPWGCVDGGFQGARSEQAAQGVMELILTKLASHHQHQAVLESSSCTCSSFTLPGRSPSTHTGPNNCNN